MNVLRRSAALFGALSALTLVAGHAAAQGVDELGTYGGLEKWQYESPQHAAVELRFGPYTPSVDDEFSGATPYADAFGDKNRYLLGLEVDWQLLQIPSFGTLGPGIGIGYTTASGKARVASTGTESDQETSLSILPMYLVGVLRIDVFAQDLGIPFVPYGKLGLGYALWWSNSGDDTARDDAGIIGRDTSYGWQFALGGMLHLDIFDPRSAADMDMSTGVNNSYLFIEWYVSHLDGFGGDKMDVGTNTWMLGLALEL